MALEIEKKYRLTKAQRAAVLRRLPEIGAQLHAEEFEENTLYQGQGLDLGRSVLRLRRVGEKAILTFKSRFPSSSSIKRQREEETRIADPDALNAILHSLGFQPALVYEKRRATWILGKTEIVIDELPFGLFMEIEGREKDIKKVEKELAIASLKAENLTYPQLTAKHGVRRGRKVEARFHR